VTTSEVFVNDSGPTFDELLDELADRDVEVLTEFFQPATIQEGQNVFRDEEAADSFYIIRTGEIQIRKTLDPDTEEPTPLVTLSDGNLLGEMSFITEGSHSAAAVATRTTELYEIRREDFDRLLQHHPTVAFKIYDAILRVLAYRLRRTDEKLVELARQAGVDLLTGRPS